MTDLAVLPTPPLNISEWNGRVVTEAAFLQERDAVNLVCGFRDYTDFTVRPIALTHPLDMNSHCFSIVLSSYQGINDIEIDRLAGALVQRYSTDAIYRFAIARHGCNYLIGIILIPSPHEFLDMKARFQL